MKKSLFLFLGFVFSAGASVNPAGQLVTRFGVNGTATLSLSDAVLLYYVVVDSQQRIIAVGQLANSGALVARFLPTGQLDTSFNGIGYKTFYYNNTGDLASTVSLLGDTIYVGGFNGAGGTVGFVASLNDDGSFNQSWGTEGIYHFTTPTMRILYDIEVQQDGKVLVGGYQTLTVAGHLARIDAAGTALDTTFNAAGTAGYQTITGYGTQSFVVGKNGSIYVLGRNNTNSIVCAFTSAGIPDTSFNGTGVSQVLSNRLLYYIVQQSDGKWIAVGKITSTNNCVFMRLTPSGLVDTSFGNAGTLIFVPFAEIFYLMQALNDNLFVLYFSLLDGLYYIASYDKNGALITTFGNSGTVLLENMTNEASAVTFAANGTLAIVGDDATSGFIQELTDYNPGQVGFTDTSLSLVPNAPGESTVVVTPVYRVPVTNQEVLPVYVRAGLTGF